jgi:hypothetical protein
MARIALLPLETVCQGTKRLQATHLARDSENAFLSAHVFQREHARHQSRFMKDRAPQKIERESLLRSLQSMVRKNERRFSLATNEETRLRGDPRRNKEIRS